jgi:hypothetical protein
MLKDAIAQYTCDRFEACYAIGSWKVRGADVAAGFKGDAPTQLFLVSSDYDVSVDGLLC